MTAEAIRAIAFYLPQYHPIPENDDWWGKGFTEWTNVVRARPLFPGHYQPHQPADLGFYDLRVPEVRVAQAALARQYGIHGFCYYHYWFNGRRMLERPFNEVLASGQPDFPFCLCWANENWTRRWDGQESEILLRQNYCSEDDAAHLRALLPAFHDPRYLRINNQPVFLVYHASLLPNPGATIRLWRSEATKAGLPGLYLCNVESFQSDHGLKPEAGFDAAVEFAPDWTCLPSRMWNGRRHRWARSLGLIDGVGTQNTICNYDQLSAAMLEKPAPNYLRFPCVTPSWDNCARRKKGALVLEGSTPQGYGRWLEQTLKRFRAPSPQENLVFVNAWNEWAEGNHLEPCQKWGHSYLEETRRALKATRLA